MLNFKLLYNYFCYLKKKKIVYTIISEILRKIVQFQNAILLYFKM